MKRIAWMVGILLLVGVAYWVYAVAATPLSITPVDTPTTAPPVETANTPSSYPSQKNQSTASTSYPQAQSPNPTPESATPTEAQQPPAPPATQPLQPAPSTETPPERVERDYEKSPKQAEIADTVTEETQYRLWSTPNDPLLQQEWVRNATGTDSVWNSARNSTSPITIAVIDSGFALAHEDLQSTWHINTGEQGMTQLGDHCWSGMPLDKSGNNCDDDQNGYVDDWRGWDFFNIDNSPQTGETNPGGAGTTHGTKVAGLAGAATDNSVGIASAHRNTTIIPLQALSDDGSGYTSDITAAIYYAVQQGASIINMSLGAESEDIHVKNAVQHAIDNNVVVIAAAGNCGTGSEYGCDPAKPGQMSYPALYPKVIAVGAIDQAGARASFSSYGPALDIVAPGAGQMTSTSWSSAQPTNAYATYLYGTSFAAPLATQYIAALRAEHPAANVEQITSLLLASAQKTTHLAGAFYSPTYGHGIIAAGAAVQNAHTLLSSSAGRTLSLAQTGSHISEHTFYPGENIPTACTASSTTLCTARLAHIESGHVRYLPYTRAQPQAAWRWNADTLQAGTWSVSLRSDAISSQKSYILFKK